MSTSMMSREQQAVENAAVFRKKYHTLSRAAVGVTLTRTREPFRAMEALRQYAAGEKKTYKVWSILRGWEEHVHTNPGQTKIENGTVDPMAALKAMIEQDGDKKPIQGLFVMLYPHAALKQSLPFVVQLKEYARMFPETKTRLILLVPPGLTLPPELEDDIPILDFDTPSYAETKAVFEETIAAVPQVNRPKITADDLDSLISASSGLTAHEAETALSRAIIENSADLKNATAEDLRKVIMEVKVEAVKKTDILEIMPTQGMENVGGLENLKEWIDERRQCFSEAARAYGIEAPKGMLLVGPPGTGKSLAAKAVGHAMGLPLIKFDVSRVFAGIVGESEQRVRNALKMIEAMSPCVVLIDEVDKALGGAHSGGGDSGVSKRVLGAILTWMQETTAPVFNVLSANRVDTLPSELMRRGRLDEVWSVSTPNERERLEILKIHLRKRGKNPDDVPNLGHTVTRTQGYVPAEMEAAVKDAIIKAFTKKVPLTGELISEQIGNMVPLSEAFAEDFRKMQEWAEQNARPANRDHTVAPELQQAPRSRQRPAADTHNIGTGKRRIEGIS